MLSRKKFLLLVLALCVCSGAGAVAGQTVDQAMTLVKKGNLLYAKGDFEGAIANYSKAIELKPSLAIAYLQRGHSRRAQGALDKAIEDYDKAEELNPKSTLNDRQVAQAFINRGFIRRNGLQVDDAIIAYNRAIRIYPAELEAYLQRGQALLLLENFAGAIEDFNLVIEKEKQNDGRKALAYGDLGLVKLLLGKKDEATHDLEQSRKLAERNKIDIDHHLTDLAAGLLMMKRIRARRNKEITCIRRSQCEDLV